MRTTTDHLMHVTIAIGALFLAMTAGIHGVGTPVLAPVTAILGPTAPISVAPPAPAEDALPAGVVVDDGVTF
jgi:hypothetical protein